MKLPTTKQELLDKVRTSHRKLEEVTATVPADHYRRIAMIWQEQRHHTSAAMILVDVILWNTMILQHILHVRSRLREKLVTREPKVGNWEILVPPTT